MAMPRFCWASLAGVACCDAAVESARTALLLKVVLAVAEERSAVFAGAESIVMEANAGVC